jgi:SAM-dependent methyltransferase
MDKIIQSVYSSYKKISNVGKVLLWICVFFIIVQLLKPTTSFLSSSSKEGFQQNDSFVFLQDNDKIYDKFYANIYDSLLYSSTKDDYELGEWKKNTNPSSHSVILDVGSGNGHHVSKLSEMGLNTIIGIDKSQAMVKKAKDNYPVLDFRHEDVMKSITFQPDTFTHILCMYFTIYYLQNKGQFFDNCFNWLKRGGYLAVHLVDKDNFDPILNPANPLLFVSAQKYAKKRITSSKVIFEGFNYESDFDFDNPKIVKFKEIFTEKGTNRVRKQEHSLYMEDLEQILHIAQESGFIVIGKIDLIKVQYEYQYLYIFQKPE